jgi:hypothetical protein
MVPLQVIGAIEKDLRFNAADEVVLHAKRDRIVEGKSNLGVFEDSFVPNDVVKVNTVVIPDPPFIAALEALCLNATGAPIAQISATKQGQKEESKALEAGNSILADEGYSVAQGNITSLAEEEATETITSEMRKKSFETHRREVLDYLNVEARGSNEMRIAAICPSYDDVDIDIDVEKSIGLVEPAELKTSVISVDAVQITDNSPLPNIKQNDCTNYDPSDFLSEILNQVNEEPLRIGCADEDLSNEMVPTIAAKSQAVRAGKSKLMRKKKIDSGNYEEMENEGRDENNTFGRNTAPFRKQRKRDLIFVEQRSLTCTSESFDPHSVGTSQSSDSIEPLQFIDQVSDICLDRFFCLGENSLPSLKRLEIEGN